MVELSLEALGFEETGDTFVAVRVGDSQKLARLSGERNFKFPQSAVGERKFGKVDVFKKVGTASIGLRHEDGMSVQEFDVACNSGTNINFRLKLADPSANAEKPPSKDAIEQGMAEVKEYLQTHNLEMLLSDAMQAVLRERPANPSEYLAERIRTTNPAHRRVQTAPEATTRTEGLTGTDAPQQDSKLQEQAQEPSADATATGQSTEASANDQGPSAKLASLKAQAQETLLDASMTGKLDETLAQLKAESGTTGEQAGTEPGAVENAPATEPDGGGNSGSAAPADGAA